MGKQHLHIRFHLPLELNDFGFFDLGQRKPYFQSIRPNEVLAGLEVLLDGLEACPSAKVSAYFSGNFLEVLENCSLDGCLDRLYSFVQNKQIQLVGGTYNHSFAGIFQQQEFVRQTMAHYHKYHSLFEEYPKVFADTQLLFTPNMESVVERLGYKAVIAVPSTFFLEKHSLNETYHLPSGLGLHFWDKAKSTNGSTEKGNVKVVEGNSLCKKSVSGLLGDGTHLKPLKLSAKGQEVNWTQSTAMVPLSFNIFQKEAVRLLYKAHNHSPLELETWRRLQDANYLLSFNGEGKEKRFLQFSDIMADLALD